MLDCKIFFIHNCPVSVRPHTKIKNSSQDIIKNESNAATECNEVQPLSLCVNIKNKNNAQIEITELGNRKLLEELT